MSWVFDAGKIGLTALIIFAIVQVSERSTLLAALLAGGYMQCALSPYTSES